MSAPPAFILRTFELSDQEFSLFQKFFFEQIGISLSNQKKILLLGRFNRRLNELGLNSFRDYYDIISAPENHVERQHAVDLITTNETYFFREDQHFKLLQDTIVADKRKTAPTGSPLRVWSAACSTGEEPYSIAMSLHHAMGGTDGWEIIASDISMRVLASAQRGLFPLERVRGMPTEFLKKYCLRGQGEFSGHLLIEKFLRDRVNFIQVNLMALPSELRNFDVVFLRNVIIYFDAATKLKVLRSVVNTLRPNGWLLLGHSESLFGMDLPLRMIAPSVYRRI